jgi:hypothetical protein
MPSTIYAAACLIAAVLAGLLLQWLRLLRVDVFTLFDKGDTQRVGVECQACYGRVRGGEWVLTS